MTDHTLKNRLQYAAAGRAAEAGPDAPNLPADALKELERLWTIEAMVAELYAVAPQNYPTDKLYTIATTKITGDAIAKRLEIGRRLGAAVGAKEFGGRL